MSLLVQVTLKNVYGQTLAYPMNDTAKTLASMVDRKTLTKRDLMHCLTLGATLEFYMHGNQVAKISGSCAGLSLPTNAVGFAAMELLK